MTAQVRELERDLRTRLEGLRTRLEQIERCADWLDEASRGGPFLHRRISQRLERLKER